MDAETERKLTMERLVGIVNDPTPERRSWKHAGVSFGIYPWDWAVSVEKFGLLTVFCFGPLCLTIHRPF